ncbi:MAG TPA: hypothetical protein VGL11_16525 [Candidatus Binatia bacterium]|jgi:photosystem II stability/assembly factor-like uncharacterized protein
MNQPKQALHVATMSGWYRFEKDGEAWQQTRRALAYWSLTCLSIDPENRRLVYAGSEHSGLFFSTDGGASWSRANPNVPKLMLFSVLALPGTVMAGTIPAAVYKKNGAGWEELAGVRLSSRGATFPPSPELQSRTRYLAFDPAAPTRLYAGIEVGGLLLSDDAGRNWQAANDGLTDPDVHEVLPCEKNSQMVFAACGDKAFRSFDRAAHWEEITPASHDYGMSLAEDGDGAIYLGSAKGRPNTWLRESGADAAIFRSGDVGSHWEIVTQGLRGGVMSMCANSDGGIIAGTSDGELIAVTDAGARGIAAGLPCITSVAVGA